MPPETHDSSVGLFPLGAVGELPAASGIPWLSARIEIQSNPNPYRSEVAAHSVPDAPFYAPKVQVDVLH